jgi:DNA-binding transcriptional regulator YiaG
MMHLAWLSSDPRVRTVAGTWHSLAAVARGDTRIEESCSAAGISAADFIGGVVGTGWELGMDISAFLAESVARAVSLRSAIGHALMMGQPVEVWLSATDWNRTRDRLLAAWSQRASGEASALRRRLRLSQAQFAHLFMTGVRTVRRWEARLSALTRHQQFFLQLFVRYVERNGVREFRRRFVREAPRHGKAGRPVV